MVKNSKYADCGVDKMVNIENKKWPSSPLKEKNLNPEQLKQFLRIRADYEKSAFVQEGHFEVRALGAKEFTKPIPPGESGITALLHHPNGHIYGATSGRNAHMFFYNPAPDADAVADIGIVAEKSSITKLLVLTLREEHGEVVGLVNKEEGGAFLFVYKPCEVLLKGKDFGGMGVREIFDLAAEDQLFFSTIDPCHSAGRIGILKKPLFDEHISDMALDKTELKLFLLGAKSGTLYCCKLIGKEVTKIGQLDPNGNFSPKLASNKNGMIYGAGLYGELFVCNPEDDSFKSLGIKAPSLKGRELYNRVTSWVLDENRNILYGGTADGIIFQFFPEENRIVCLGKATDQTNVCAMTISGGTVYALIGEKGECCHLTSYDDSTRELRDLGCPLARSERPWNGYEFASMTTGKDGIVFMGENDRISHLFMYFPPVK